MTEDGHGFLHPTVDKDKCIGCTLCERKCPILSLDDMRNKKANMVVAAWHKDDQTRMSSSSGGAFSALAEYVLSRGGVVWGAAYDNHLKLRYQFVDTADDLSKLRRSKYIQSEVGNTFLKVKQQLQEGKEVLFVGTSCHIRGLYQIVGPDLRNGLITADFVCHGVPSPGVFRKYKTWIENKYSDQLVDFNFRDKRYGWDNGVLTIGTFARSGEHKFMNDENSYFTGMLNNMFIRECCHKCCSNGLERHADFTLADFWGIGRNIPFKHEKEKRKGISMLALNSEKARELFDKDLCHRLIWEKRTLDEATRGNGNFVNPSHKNPKSNLFWKMYETGTDWEDMIKILRPSFSQQCKLFVKRFFGPTIANKLRKLTGR